MTGALLHLFVGVALVGGLLWLASKAARAYGARGLGSGGRDEALRVVARRQMVKGASVVRVSVEDKDLLLGVSDKGVGLLCELPKTPAPNASRAGEATFAATGWQPRPSFAEALARSLSLRRERG